MVSMENKVGEDVGRVNATDKDEKNGDNWRITYSIIKGDSSGNFAIRTDRVTNQGIISVVKVCTLINSSSIICWYDNMQASEIRIIDIID